MELKTQALNDELTQLKKKSKKSNQAQEQESKSELLQTKEFKDTLKQTGMLKEIDLLTTPILKGFIFNNQVIDMVEEIDQIHQEILNIHQEISKLHGVQPFESSGKIIFTEELSLDLGSETTTEEPNNNKAEKEEKCLNLLEGLLKRKEDLENDLGTLQANEKKKYERIETLEKQNFDVKSFKYIIF